MCLHSINSIQKQDMKTEIYIVTHKNFIPPEIEGYVPIEVGTALRTVHTNFIKDDVGDNISEKNKTFCELTGFYWIWKNIKCDNVAICHYRRYFSKSRVNTSSELFIKPQQIERILNDYDIIMPEPWYWRRHTVASGYIYGNGKEKDLLKIGEIIKDRFPEYYDSYTEVLSRKKISYCNMLAISKKLFNQYCEWLFTILFDAEKNINIALYSDAEKRVFGYLSEILLNVWVRKKELKVYYCPMVFNDLEKQGKKMKLFKNFDRIPLLRELSRTMNCRDSIF